MYHFFFYLQCIKDILSATILEPNCKSDSSQHYVQIHQMSLEENRQDHVLPSLKIPELECPVRNNPPVF